MKRLYSDEEFEHKKQTFVSLGIVLEWIFLITIFITMLCGLLMAIEK